MDNNNKKKIIIFTRMLNNILGKKFNFFLIYNIRFSCHSFIRCSTMMMIMISFKNKCVVMVVYRANELPPKKNICKLIASFLPYLSIYN